MSLTLCRSLTFCRCILAGSRCMLCSKLGAQSSGMIGGLFLLGSNALTLGLFATLGKAVLLAFDLGILLIVPDIETAIGLGLVERTFLHPVLQVVAIKNTGVTEDRTAGIAGLGTVLEPFQRLVGVHLDESGVLVRIVSTDPFNILPVTW